MKKWIFRIVIGFIIIVVLFVALILLALFSGAGCDANILEKFPSPSGKIAAVVYNYDCGVGSGFNTQISILDSDELPFGSSDMFVIDSDHNLELPRYEKGGPIVRINWISENQLNISYPKKSRIFKNEKNSEGVQVKYSEY